MLAVVDVPEYLSTLNRKCQKLSLQLLALFGDKGTLYQIPGNQDILKRPPGFIFVNDGFYKFYHGEKLIRLYAKNDSLWIQDNATFSDCQLACEFGSEITVVDSQDVYKTLAKENTVQKLWLTWQELDTQVMRLLSTLYIEEKSTPNIAITTAKKGDVIIREGDKPDKIYIMVDGRAEVTKGGTKIGMIEPEEVFGEISFFADLPRTCTVTASSDCLIQEMSYDDFLKCIPTRPKLIMTLSKSLSNRIVKLDEELAGKS